MQGPIEPKPEYAQYGLFSLAALLGSIARAGKWTDDRGKFSPSKLITEMAAAIVLGIMAVGLSAYMGWKPEIGGGLAGAGGLMGATGVTGIMQSIVSLRFGGKKNDASDAKPGGV